MSDVGGAYQRLGNAIFGAGMTIYDKLNKADEVMQFQAGQQTLANMANQFDQQLATNPNHDKWMEDNETFQSQAFDTVSKTMKNQGAINALNTWWDSNKIERNKQLNGKIISARIGENLGLLQNNVDSVMKGAGDAEAKKAKILEFLNGAESTNLLDKEQVVKTKDSLFQKIDGDAAETNARNELYQKGMNVDDVNNEVYNNHLLSDEQKASITRIISADYAHSQAMLKEKQTKEISQIETDAFNKIDHGTWGQKDMDSLDASSPQLGPGAAAAYHIIHDYMKSVDKERNGGSGTQESHAAVTALYDEWLNTTDHSSENAHRFGVRLSNIKDHTAADDREWFNMVKQPLNPQDEGLLKQYSPNAAQTPAEKSASQETIKDGYQALAQNSDKTIAQKKQILSDINDVNTSKYINKQMGKIWTGEPNFLGWTGISQQERDFGELINSGKLAEAVKAEDPIATQRWNEFRQQSAASLSGITGIDIHDIGASIKPNEKKDGNLIEAVQYESKNGKKVPAKYYRLRFSPKGGQEWYETSAANYPNGPWVMVTK